MPIRYDASAYDHLASTYDITRGLLPDEAAEVFADTVVRLTGAQPETVFVEPGVGTGRVAWPLVRRGFPYVGIDTSPVMMEGFRRKLETVPNRLALVRGDATSLPMRDASFDVALTASVLYLVPDWRRALAELRRVLRPDGLYLYCYEEAEGNDAAQSLDKQWWSILTRYEFPHAWYSTVTTDECRRVLRDEGAALDTGVAAEWVTERRVDDYLAAYPIRVRPLYWQVPDEVFAAALGDLTAWANDHFRTDVVTISYRFRIVTVTVRDWARG